MTAKYDLSLNQGSNLDLWIQYLTDGNTAVDLSSYSAEMQIRRSKDYTYPLMFLTKSGVTYGYTGGFTTGIAGIGGISLNTNYTGSSITGGIYIKANPTSTANLPVGRHFYDLELSIGTTLNIRILEGKIDIVGEVTR